MSTRLIVRQKGKVVADVPDYDGPTPVEGMYLFHPPFTPQDARDDPWNGGISGCVKQVCMAIYGRPRNGEKHFTGRNTNIIEVHI
jgi:hypothetical protein